MSNAIIQRYAERLLIRNKYYSMDYGPRFNPTRDPKTNKVKYKKSPGDKFSPFWFVDHNADFRTYEIHLTKDIANINEVYENKEFQAHVKKENETYNKIDAGVILPPCDLDGDSEYKGLVHWGAIDEDVYDKPDHLKRIVQQIYDEKLPLAPCYSKSGGLHIYMFVKKGMAEEGDKMVNALKHYKKILKATAQEIFPKQTKPKWDDKKKRWSPGNGILVPYKSCIVRAWDNGKQIINQVKPENPWIKNRDLETGTVEEFLDYCDTIEVDEEFFKNIPIDLEERVKNDEPTTAKSNEKPSSDLDGILNNIRSNVDHKKGGTFDNWIVDYVATAIGKHNQSDDEIIEQLNNVKDKSEKAEDKNYFIDKISNCREKFGTKDPGPQKKQFMENTFYLMDQEKYVDFRTGKPYGERAIETKFHKIFGGGMTAPTYFKKHQTDKNIAESSKYNPGKWSKTTAVFRDIDNLQYFNSYRPGPLTPREVKTQGDLEKFFKLVKYMVPNDKYREWVLDWMAGIIQNKGHKWRWVIFFYSFGKQVGKGSIFRVMELILGEDNTMETQVALMLDKGSMYTDRQLVLIDECKSKGDWAEKNHLANDLKMIITGKKVSARRMRVDYKQVQNNANFMIFSNDKKAISLDDEDKRYLVIHHDSPRLTQKFYDSFHDWLEGPDKTKKDGTDGGAELIYDYLLRRSIELPLHGTAPETEFQKEMEQSSTNPVVEQLKEWMGEENGPFSLELGDIRGTTELSQYIQKNCSGKVVKLGSDPKFLKESLLKIGAKFIGQVRHKIRKEKPTLCIVRNHKEYESIKDIDLCNTHWTPLMIEKQTDTVARILDEHNVEVITKANNSPENHEAMLEKMKS
tara:strand:+ start:1244 stop:3808 length:2565 start_codon:yes stop_codon:yes gene_type:complete